MSKGTKKWLIAAAFLVTAGAIMFAAAMTAYRWDFFRLSTDHFERNTYDISEEFSSIILDTETADILFTVSDDNMCQVVCFEDAEMKHSVRVQDGALTVSAVDERPWYEHIGIHFRSPEVTVSLPGTEFDSLVINAGTGDVEIPDEIRVGSADISLGTGDIRIRHMSAGTLELSTSTGSMIISDVTCTGSIKADSSTGSVDLTDVTCENLLSTGGTGDVSLKNVIAAGKFSIERSTGNVIFDSADATDIFVDTSKGDVTGSLLSEKVFTTATTSGTVSVPGTKAGGKCVINTSTGNISIEIPGDSGK